jgi:adenosylcobinamide kinase/adenosylcobinamide-phosphate guanylyltransferase
MHKKANEISFEISSDVMAIAERLIRENPDVVIVTDEIGYGIVPVDKAEREYREVAGRICTRLAAEADEVYRVICGIGTRIK